MLKQVKEIQQIQPSPVFLPKHPPFNWKTFPSPGAFISIGIPKLRYQSIWVFKPDLISER